MLFLNRVWISGQQPLSGRGPAAVSGEPARACHLLQVLQLLPGECQQLQPELPGTAAFPEGPAPIPEGGEADWPLAHQSLGFALRTLILC